MIPWSMSPSNNRLAAAALIGLAACLAPQAVRAAEREPVTMRVVAVNPSVEKTRSVPVRIDLPQEVKPADILDKGEMEVDYDTERSLYYVHRDDVQLAPKQTKVFEVIVRDVWMIPDEELEGLKGHTQLLLSRLEKSEYYPFAKQLGGSITGRLDSIRQMQSDESIGRKQRIGSFRTNQQTMSAVKEDLSRMEKLLSFTGGPPVLEMMEESALKSDAPSTTTTWLVIFLVIIFMGLPAGQFFFTWQRRVKMMPEFGSNASPSSSTGPGAHADEGRHAPTGRTPSR